MKTNKILRGFGIIEFYDLYGEACSLQKSSLATNDAIWFGIDKVKPLIMSNDAKTLGITPYQDCGWVDYPIPEQVFISSRMHLTRKQVAELLPHLQKFVETGNL